MINYTIDFSEFNRHTAHISLEFVATKNMSILWLPTWIAGSYLIREFAKNIANVIYYENNTPIRAKKLSKNSWQIPAKIGQKVRVEYTVYCFDLSCRTAYIDNERIFGNFSSLLLLTDKADNLPPCTIDLVVPNTFFDNKDPVHFVVGLPFSTHKTGNHTCYRLCGTRHKALNGFEMMDFPFEIGEQSTFDFYTHLNDNNTLHRFFVSGVHRYDSQRLKADLTKICQAYTDWLGWQPFEDYTFLTHATKNEYGGLEHINSTALITPRDDLPYNETDEPSDGYKRFLGLCSHEYFHAWWVKSVRPDVMMTSDLQHEAYTPLLWVFEGFTSYIDDLMLYKAGVIGQDSYLQSLAEQLTRLSNNKGRAYQTVAESSFDAWIKLYRPDENSINSTTSYYNKGAIVALGLDLLLIRHNARLFDVIKVFVDKAKTATNYRFAMTDENLQAVLTQFLPNDVWQDFKNSYIDGVSELPIKKWLDDVNIRLDKKSDTVAFGLEVESGDNGLVVKNIDNDSGLSVKDIIIAIDGLKADKKYLTQADKPITVHAFRRDVLMRFVLTPKSDAQTHKISLTQTAPSVWLDF